MQTHNDIADAIAQTKLALGEMHHGLELALIHSPHAVDCTGSVQSETCTCWRAQVYDIYKRWS